MFGFDVQDRVHCHDAAQQPDDVNAKIRLVVKDTLNKFISVFLCMILRK